MITFMVGNEEVTLTTENSERIETLSALFETTHEEMVNRLVQKGLAAQDTEDGIPS